MGRYGTPMGWLGSCLRVSVWKTQLPSYSFSHWLAFLFPLICPPARRVKAVDEGESLRCWPPAFATAHPLLWVRVQGWGWEQMDRPETYPSFVMRHGARCNPSFCESLSFSLSLSFSERIWDSLSEILNKIPMSFYWQFRCSNVDYVFCK